MSDNSDSYLTRFLALGEFLKNENVVKVLTFKTFPPVSDEEVAEVEKKINQKLPTDFLLYFKQSNGYQLRYKIQMPNQQEQKQKEDEDEDEDEGEEVAAFKIPSLKEIFDSPIENFGEPGEHNLEILGGKDDYQLRTQMYAFDKYDEWRDEQIFNGVYYVVGDNVLLLSNDYAACISDAHPITVPSYMELCLATAGLIFRRRMLERGCGGDWKTVDYGRMVYSCLGPWARLIVWELFKRVTPEFFALCVQATDKKGYYLRFMAPAVIDDLNKM